MILDAVTGSSQWLDGGATFGSCPRDGDRFHAREPQRTLHWNVAGS